MKTLLALMLTVSMTTAAYADHAMLKDAIAEKMNQSSGMSDDIKKTMKDGIKEVKQSGILKKAINKGDIAPNFTLPDQNGNSVELYSLLENGPVVLMWYRGVWCPYCNLTLRFYQEELSHIKDHGATLVVISSQLPDATLSTVEKNELDYLVLSDVESKVGKEYGVIFTLNEELAALYQQFGIDLKAHQGNERNELPLAATYVIDQERKVRFAFLDADYKKRAEPVHVINTLSQISDVSHHH